MKRKYRVKPHGQYDGYVIIYRKLLFLPIWIEVTYFGPCGETGALRRGIDYINRQSQILYEVES